MKNRIFQKFVIFLTISIFLYGCGTIWNGTSDKINIKSTPSNAKVTIKNDNGALINTGKTPMTIKLNKKHDYTVAINLDGYNEQIVNVNSSFNALWLMGNIFLCGGIAGIVVDAITGGWNDLEPSSINISLVTAYNENYEEMLYTIYTMRDEEGQLRQWKVPMLKN